MIDTSAAYKEQVVTKVYARHFVPSVLIKILDTNARSLCSYSSASSAFCSNLSQLINEVYKVTYSYGTLEPGLFNLGGGKCLMPSSDSDFHEVGYMSESMSDSTGTFSTPLEALICTYTTLISTVGRTLYFDDTMDFVPSDFDLIYYRNGTEIARSQVRDNTLYLYTDTLGVQRYDKMILSVISTTVPYRRPRIVEDIPGVYLLYDETNVVSLNFTQTVDVFCKEIISGEMDIVVQNASKTLDILNPDGYEKYLQKRQEVDVYINMVFPDNTIEAIHIGKLSLVDWKSNKGALTASFTARDTLDKLSLDEYIKGTIPSTVVSYYELAEAVLIDAGVTNYTIDIELLNIYTKACLPIASHKELLRLIAQASRSVVLPTLNGGVHIKFFSPLVIAYNVLTNPSFNDDLNNWTTSGVTLNTTEVYYGKQSAKLTSVAYLTQNYTFITSHIYYISAYVIYTGTLTTGTSGIYIDGTLTSTNFVSANILANTWTNISMLYSAGTGVSKALSIQNNGSEAFSIGGILCIDLTSLYGAGNEPTVDWCDQNIRYFTTSLAVPRAVEPEPVSTITYNNLMDAPEISILAATKSIETMIYSYTKDTATSEIYSGTREIIGTEEFVIKFSYIADGCTITVASLDSNGDVTATNTATLVSSSIYGQAAKIKVQANSNVLITVTGYKVTTGTSSFKLNNDVDPSVILDATAVSIDNKLITLKTVAEDVSTCALFWYKKVYQYSFDWRQDPSIEDLDTVTVQDDFSRNNNIMITDRTLEFNDGILSGDSVGIY